MIDRITKNSKTLIFIKNKTRIAFLHLRINFDKLNTESLNKAFNVNTSTQAIQNNQGFTDIFHQQVKLPKLQNIMSKNSNVVQLNQSVMNIKQEVPSISAPIESNLLVA